MVGHVFATYVITGTGAGDPQAGQPPGALISVGAMVANVDSGGSPTNAVNINPIERDEYTDPWIWRKVWVLGQGMHMTREGPGLANLAGFRPSAGAQTDVNGSFAQFPLSNTESGTMADSPYVDQKTNRVIGPEQRLILFFGSKALPIQGVNAVDAAVAGYLEFRLLGSLQRASNRRNAAR